MYKLIALAFVAALASGCASTPPATQTAQTAQSEKTKDTGTILPVANHGRMLKFVGNQSYREDASQLRSINNEVGGRSN